jgi:putative hydrolase of the HAD superfamily
MRHDPASQALRDLPIYDQRVYTAVLWDFGGVILSSPFEAFNHYEADAGLPRDFIRSVNAANPHTNAWARLERSDITTIEFDQAFADDSRALGHEVRGADVLALLAGEIRPRMVAALDALSAAGYRIACLTNNVVTHDDPALEVMATDRSAAIAQIMGRFDAIVESSKVGVRKPEPRFYEIACELLGVQPNECVFLDDLGINLKPAAAMGMTTIKVVDPDVALAELSLILDISL